MQVQRNLRQTMGRDDSPERSTKSQPRFGPQPSSTAGSRSGVRRRSGKRQRTGALQDAGARWLARRWNGLRQCRGVRPSSAAADVGRLGRRDDSHGAGCLDPAGLEGGRTPALEAPVSDAIPRVRMSEVHSFSSRRISSRTRLVFSLVREWRTFVPTRSRHRS